MPRSFRKRMRSRQNKKFRRVKRRRYGKNSVVIKQVPRMAGPFPDQYRCVFTYSANLLFNVVNNQHVFSMNNLFDPDVSATGGQPVWYDQLCSANGPYLSYRVLASRIRCTFVPDSASVPAICGILPSDSTSAPIGGTPSDYISNNRVKWTVLNEGTSTPSKTLKQYATVATVSGQKKSVVRDSPNYQALYNASPQDQTYWQIFINAMDATSNVSVRVLVHIDYYTQLADKPRPQSIN